MNTTAEGGTYASTTPGTQNGPPPVFATTHWSAVLTACSGDTPRARVALGGLCQTYWYPLYAYVRRRGHPAHDAQDLTQEFFAQLLERHSLATASPQRGRFRSFLLTALNHFLANEWHKARTGRRGGGNPVTSLDWAEAEKRYDLEPADHRSPDKLFEKQWALTLLSEVLNRLETEYQQDGKLELFTALKQTLTGTRESQPYLELAEKLDMNEGAIKVAVHRLRRRYRDLIRAAIADTLDETENIDDEMRHLFSALTEK